MANLHLSVEPFLNSDQAAAMLGIHPKTLQRLARRGRITAYRIGKLWRFHACDLESDVMVRAFPLDDARRHEPDVRAS